MSRTSAVPRRPRPVPEGPGFVPLIRQELSRRAGERRVGRLEDAYRGTLVLPASPHWTGSAAPEDAWDARERIPSGARRGAAQQARPRAQEEDPHCDASRASPPRSSGSGGPRRPVARRPGVGRLPGSRYERHQALTGGCADRRRARSLRPRTLRGGLSGPPERPLLSLTWASEVPGGSGDGGDRSTVVCGLSWPQALGNWERCPGTATSYPSIPKARNARLNLPSD